MGKASTPQKHEHSQEPLEPTDPELETMVAELDDEELVAAEAAVVRVVEVPPVMALALPVPF